MGSADKLVSLIKRQLTDEELRAGVAYATEEPIAAGKRFNFPGVVIEMPSDAHLVFIDRQPTANWGHSCRYLALDLEKGEMRSWESRFPPFGVGAGKDHPRWRIVYRAPSVPDAAIRKPQEDAVGPEEGTTKT